MITHFWHSVKRVYSLVGDPVRAVMSTSRHLLRPARAALASPAFRVCSSAAAPAPAHPAEDASEPRPFSEMPGPSKLPLLQAMHHLLPGGRYFNVPALQLIERLKGDYGRIVRIDIPFKVPTVMIYEPDAAQTVFQADGRNPIRGEFAPYKYYRSTRGLGAGIAPAEGEQWREYRAMGQSVLGGPQSALKYVDSNTESANMLVDHLRRVRGQGNTVEAFQDHAKLWSFESMNMMALGYPVGIYDNNAEAQRLFNATSDLFDCFTLLDQSLPFWRLVSTSTYKRMCRAVDVVAEVCRGYVERALEDPKEGSMVGQAAPEITSEREREMVTDVFADLLFSAIDTTSTTLTYLLYCLAKHPEAQARARDEVLSLLPSTDSKITPSVVNKMSYVKACLKEALRVHHVALGVGRVLSKEAIVGGYRVPPGVKCVIMSGIMSNDPEYFDQPEAFLPERWVRSSPQYAKPRQWTYLPFGHGVRTCIGRRFAELETWVAAAQILRNFEVRPVTQEITQVLKLINVPDRSVDLQFVDFKP